MRDTQTTPTVTLSPGRYASTVALALVYGVGLALASGEWAVRADLPWWAAFAALGVAIAGTMITLRTPDWRGSLVGHTVSAVALGVLLGDGFPPEVLRNGASHLAIAGPAACLAAFAFGTGRISQRVATALTILVASASTLALGVLMTAASDEVVTADVAWHGLTAGVFAWLLVRWWLRVLTGPRTRDAAVDAACAIYLDPVTLALQMADRLIPKPNSPR